MGTVDSNFGNKHSKKQDDGVMDAGDESEDSMVNSIRNKVKNEKVDCPKGENDWLKELEIQTCECDSRSLLQGPQFSIDFTCIETNSNNVPTPTTTKGKKKKGGAKKAESASETTIVKQQSNETSQQSL